MLTTVYSYGEVQPQEQAEIIQELGLLTQEAGVDTNADAIAEAVFRKFNDKKLI